APAPAPAKATPAPTPAQPVARALPPYLDPNSDLSKQRSVFFDFDQQAIKPEFTGLIELHGKFLSANPAVAIRIEGNADERGSSEYNLALGQRRAESVRKALQLLGVKEGQMEAISYGKERPRATGHDEAAWSQNRRADLQYPTK
ncbi:MAG TPA: peptidoglycan-associated lipoprotein Pal, partial [Burkholderiaceae bacterium]|nr:peptidoglycan-associated lipoprotein Pal [Burkholderiaceae bacterium]